MSTDIHTPGDGPGFFDRTLDVLRRGEAEDIVRQARVGGVLSGTVGQAALNLSYGVALPAGGKSGQVALFSPAANVIWIMLAEEIGSAVRWWNLSAGTYLRYTIPANLGFTTHSTPNTAMVVWTALFVPYTGGWRFRFQSSVRPTGAYAANTGYIAVAQTTPVMSQIGDATMYGQNTQWEARSAAKGTPIAHLTAGVGVGVIQSNNLSSANFEMYYPEMEAFCQYIDVPK